ncbi:MAG: carbon starvation CstA family protein, partial [Elusimicrobiota bacterium]
MSNEPLLGRAHPGGGIPRRVLPLWTAPRSPLRSRRLPPTPPVRLDDGEDFVPARAPVLLGPHIAAIAAVGPIAGPIIAGAQYGWLPGLFWITAGAVFIGGVHDFAALALSVRHGARSIGSVFGELLGARASRIFSAFIWLSLLYVIVVFTDLTSSAFVSRPELGAAN